MASLLKRGIIIGGGIGGLCTAIGLHQSGVTVIIYEQAEKLGQAGAGLTLWPNAIKALRQLGLADEVIKTGSRIDHADIRTASGRTLSRSHPGELERLFGEPTIAIHRADLHDILLSALPANTLHLGAKCTGIEQQDDRASVSFTNGHTDHADLIVAADGIHSVVRQQLFPEIKLRYSGYTAWRGIVATSDEAALGTTSESWGRGSRFGIVRIDREHVYWFAAANAPKGTRQNPAERKNFLQLRFKGWHHPVELLIDATPAEEILHNDIYDLKPLKHWGKGRIILLGDAAHPTTPNMGQGACMAIESSVVLVRCLSRTSDLADALSRYQAERMPRTAWITDQSWKIGRIGQLNNPLACMFRDLALRLTPASLARKTLEKAVGFEL